MGIDGGRRDLFRSATERWVGRMLEQAQERVVARRWFRPPGALPEIGFLAACTRCGKCAEVCPPRAILTACADSGLAAGTPYLDPSIQPCTVCPDMPCVEACPTEALTMPAEGWRHYRLAELTLVPERCITFDGLACGVCAGACPVGAEALAMDEQGHPVIRREGCVGCGVCMRACVTTPSSFQLSLAEG